MYREKVLIVTIFQLLEACSHSRSWELFAHSINNTVPYMASSCDDFSNSLGKHCNGDSVVMGEATPNTTRGVYYLETTATVPYVKSISTIDDNHL